MNEMKQPIVSGFMPIKSKRNMITLITHEESQTVITAMLNNGADAYSNDLLPCSGSYPERHLQMDCFEAIKVIKPI